MIGEQAKELIIQWRDQVNALLVPEDKSKKYNKNEEFIPIPEKNLGTISNERKNAFPSEASCFKKAKENIDEKQKNEMPHDEHTTTKHKRSFEEMLALPAVSRVKKKKKKKSEFIPKVTEKIAEVCIVD